MMRTIATTALLAAAAVMIGCATLSYEGMPAKEEPHAVAVEERGIDFLAVDGRPVHRPAFSLPKLRLTPGRHEILTRFDTHEQDTDYMGELTIDISVHYWSRFLHTIGLETREGSRYYIGAQANLPRTGISYELWQRELPPDHEDTKEGRIEISIEHELTTPDDWRPIITRTGPIKKYWKNRPLPAAEIKGRAASPAMKPPAPE